MSYQSVFLHQTPSKSTEIVHPRGDRRLVKVVTRKYHDPAHKPLPLFCLILAGVWYLRDSTVNCSGFPNSGNLVAILTILI